MLNAPYLKSAALKSLKGITPTDGSFIVGDGTKHIDESGATARASMGVTIGTDVLAQQTIGIADNNLLEIDQDGVADNDFAKFTATGLEGRSYTETVSDLSLVIGTNTQAQGDVLDDLNTLGAATEADKIILSSGAGAFSYGDPGHKYVNRDSPATPDWDQIYIDDFIDAQNDFHLIDNGSGDFVTDGVQVGDWAYNKTGALAYAQVTAVNSGTDLTLDANIFPDNDGDRYNIWTFKGNNVWTELDLSSIIDSGTVLVRVRLHAKQAIVNTYIHLQAKGETGINYAPWKLRTNNVELWHEALVVPDSSGVIEYKADLQAPPNIADDYFDMTVVGWWA